MIAALWPELRARAIEVHAIEPALRRVEYRVDARELFLGDDIGAELRFDFGELGVVRLLVGGEGAIEVLDRDGGFRRLGFETVLFIDVHGFSLSCSRAGALAPRHSGRRREYFSLL